MTKIIVLLVLMLCFAGGQAAAAQEGAARTVVLELASRIYGNVRALRVHLPADYHDPSNAARRYPVLLMGDGFALFNPGSWNAPAMVDSLAASGDIEPLILVGIDNAASIPGVSNPAQARANEYLPYPDALEPDLDPNGALYPDFLTMEVLPLLRERFRVTDSAEGVVIGGSSYSAIAALYAGIRLGDRVGALLLESPPVFMFEERLTEEVSGAPDFPPRLYIGIGTQETADTAILLRGEAALDRLVATAAARGTDTRLNEVDGATHDSRSWAARFPAALKFLFPTVDTQ